MPANPLRAAAGAVAGLCAAPALSAPGRTVIVEAPRQPYRSALIRVVLTPPAGAHGATVTQGRTPIVCQTEESGGKLAVAWFARDLRKGERRVYGVSFVRGSGQAPRYAAKRAGANMDLLFGGELFARYDVTTGPNKPYFHPIYGPGQRQVVRGYPVSPRTGETHDHIHHRGLWFTHGSVNGEDFWAETQSKTVHRSYERVQAGPVCGAFTALTDWFKKDGTRIAEDRREFQFYECDGIRVLDVAIRLTPVGGPLVLGDTKEGSFGLRLADSMRLSVGGGHIVNSEGAQDGATWGKRASWVDYFGTVEGGTVGVAILEHPASFRYPTWWHVRDYGLFCANPFGIHDFETGQSATAGNHTVPVGRELALRYRLLFHSGTAVDAGVSERWNEYADPPRVSVK